MTKLHLCEQCAREKSAEMEEHFGLADLLSGLADLVPIVGEKQNAAAEVKLKCSSCGFTFQDFRKTGRLGCPKCYDTFGAQLSPLLKKIHGSDTHIGKTPLKKEAVQNKLALLSDLKVKLEASVRSEEFEQAARLRDQIRALERKNRK